MPVIKSLEDLNLAREEALEKRKQKIAAGVARVAVAMGTCGIATGAGETMQAILNYIETHNVSGVDVTQTGCIGMCESEPIVQVFTGEKSRVIYGKVTPEIARRILVEHVQGGKVVSEYVIPA